MGFFHKDDLEEVQHEQSVEKQVPEIKVVSPSLNCSNCAGAGLQDQHTVCSKCGGTGHAADDKVDFAEGALVITNGMQHRVVNGKLVQI